MSKAIREFLNKSYFFNRMKPRKIIKYTGIGIGVVSLAASPILIANSSKDAAIINKANGVLRFARSLKIGLWISLDYYFAMAGLDESSDNFNVMMSRIHQRSAEHILDGCLSNGGCYIKLGQGLVSMSHILPKEYIETLRVLQDKCLKRESGELEKIFKKDFGKNPEELFKEFNKEPIAAASIAQVYKATTKEGNHVAVKVQYIDLQQRFGNDVITIRTLLKIAGTLHPDYDFSWVIDDLENTLRQELDFINEGLNSERCSRDLKHLRYIHVPKVYWDYTSSRVLVTEFINGYKISDLDNLRKDKFSLVDLNKKLFEAFGHQIFQSGFVHGDPHPGNVLVRMVKGDAQLVLLDHGLYQEVSPKDRKSLSYLWNAIVLNDQESMKKYSNELGVKNHELFAEILTQQPLKSRGFKIKAQLTDEDLRQMTEFAKEKFDSIMICLKEMPRSLLLVLRNLNTIRAIAQHHGNPIDRYSILARTATKSIYNMETNLAKRLLNFPKKIYFEFILQIQRLGRWFTKTTLRILHRLGLAPDVEAFVKNLRPVHF
ncbi:unnamed protein product [Psylliodes chrysocephalus]|uniref:ABC1 atypical kinase-like domain-containing protein n=1 Tax=Psylliodes chrysocephalus TaxID=3402493 RepID=A0A9P0DB58_9CUCU|nr:unnamed protein product [Psylliodes chrysocephala]